MTARHTSSNSAEITTSPQKEPQDHLRAWGLRKFVASFGFSKLGGRGVGDGVPPSPTRCALANNAARKFNPQRLTAACRSETFPPPTALACHRSRHRLEVVSAMSALGQKRTWRPVSAMSALPPKADIGTQSWNVRFVPKADIDRERKRSLTVLLYVPSEQKFELC